MVKLRAIALVLASIPLLPAAAHPPIGAIEAAPAEVGPPLILMAARQLAANMPETEAQLTQPPHPVTDVRRPLAAHLALARHIAAF